MWPFKKKEVIERLRYESGHFRQQLHIIEAYAVLPKLTTTLKFECDKCGASISYAEAKMNWVDSYYGQYGLDLIKIFCRCGYNWEYRPLDVNEEHISFRISHIKEQMAKFKETK